MANNQHVPPPVVAVQLDYPHDNTGWDDATGGTGPNRTDAATTLVAMQALLQQPPLKKQNLRLTRLPGDVNSCYRDVALVMLFSLEPFIRFLKDVQTDATQNPITLPDQLVLDLADLADIFWDSGGRPAGTDQSPRRLMTPPMQSFWRAWLSLGSNQRGTQADPVEFVVNLFSHMSSNAIKMPRKNMLFDLMFENLLVPRYRLPCSCTTKQRGGHFSYDFQWVMDLNISRPDMTLQQAFAQSIYTQLPASRTCPTCQQGATNYEVYHKFRKLPEVFLLSISFQGTQGRMRNARCQLPALLDLSMMRDQTAGGPDQQDNRSTKYRLQSVVDYKGRQTNNTTRGHYRCHVRRRGDVWHCVDSLESRITSSSLHDIENDTLFQPRILAYVRQPLPLSPAPSPNNGLHTGNSDSDDDDDAASHTDHVQTQTPPDDLIPPAGSAWPSSAELDRWSMQTFKDNLTKGGVALLAGPTLAKLRLRWDLYQATPNDYSLYRADRLRQEIVRRNIQRAGNTKQAYVNALTQADALAAAQSTINPPNPHNGQVPVSQPPPDGPTQVAVSSPGVNNSVVQPIQDNSGIMTDLSQIKSDVSQLRSSLQMLMQIILAQVTPGGDTGTDNHQATQPVPQPIPTNNNPLQADIDRLTAQHARDEARFQEQQDHEDIIRAQLVDYTAINQDLRTRHIDNIIKSVQQPVAQYVTVKVSGAGLPNGQTLTGSFFVPLPHYYHANFQNAETLSITWDFTGRVPIVCVKIRVPNASLQAPSSYSLPPNIFANGTDENRFGTTDLIHPVRMPVPGAIQGTMLQVDVDLTHMVVQGPVMLRDQPNTNNSTGTSMNNDTNSAQRRPFALIADWNSDTGEADDTDGPPPKRQRV